MRVTDLFLAFPALILALAIEATLGRDVAYAIIALVAVWWPSYARLLRGEALKIKNMKFVDAALLSGLSNIAIISKHVVTTSLNTLISYATIDLGNTILVYSILSFLGLGVPAPAPEWGTMVASGLNEFPQWWWYAIFPGVVIAVIVIGSALLGDGIRDLFAGEL
jgi:peptide/nickel transport system permease protein